MHETHQLLNEFDSIVSAYDNFTAKTKGLIETLVDRSSVKPHSISSRIKDRASLERKIRKHSPPYTSLEEITDIGGIRITTYFADDVDVVAALLDRNFEVDAGNSVDKRLIHDPDRFGYLSIHYVVSLDERRCELPEYSQFKNMKLEIQIRSILQHAWAEMEHDMGYKSVLAVPRDLRRQFARLAGILELADEQFAKIRDDLDAYRVDVESKIVDNPQTVSLNRDSLLFFVNSSESLANLDAELAERMGYTLIEACPADHSSVLERFSRVGIETVADLDEACLSNSQQAIKFFDLIFDLRPAVPCSYGVRGISLNYLWLYLITKDNDFAGVAKLLEEYKLASYKNDSIEETAKQLISWAKQVG